MATKTVKSTAKTTSAKTKTAKPAAKTTKKTTAKRSKTKKKLVIVESPSKAKTIGKYLGRTYKVVASLGHVRDLPKSRMGVDIENDYQPDYISIRGKGDVIKDQECVKSYSNVKLPESPTAHDTIYTAQGNVITGICKKDSAHSVRMTVSGKDAVYDKTAHAVDIGIELSEEWGKVEVPYEIFYTREGAQTEDLTSPGTIKATVSVGTAKVEVVYTIKEAPAEKPVVTPTAKPTDKPTATPTAKPTKTSDSQATKKADEREKAVPKKVGAILKVKGNKYRVTKSKARGSAVEFTGYTNKKKKKVTIPESITVQGVEYDVTSIGEKAFSNCKKLTLLEIKTKKPCSAGRGHDYLPYAYL